MRFLRVLRVAITNFILVLSGIVSTGSTPGSKSPKGAGAASLNAAIKKKEKDAGKAAKSEQNNAGNITYGELDDLGRPTGISATITKDMIKTGSPANSSIKPPGFEGGGKDSPGHARGHLLGNQLGGSGDDPRNLVTLFQNPANHPAMSILEGQVRDAVESGQTVIYTATPIYQGDNLVPSGITISAKGSGGFNLSVTVINRKSRKR